MVGLTGCALLCSRSQLLAGCQEPPHQPLQLPQLWKEEAARHLSSAGVRIVQPSRLTALAKAVDLAENLEQTACNVLPNSDQRVPSEEPLTLIMPAWLDLSRQ